jgi:hypothetical protein
MFRSYDADVLRPPKIEHAIESGGSDRDLGHLASVSARVKSATYYLLPAMDVRFDDCTKLVARDLLPASATSFGDDGQMPVTLRWLNLRRRSWNRVGSRRHHNGSFGMMCSDRRVDVVAIIRPPR